jgi:hypothetical protein
MSDLNPSTTPSTTPDKDGGEQKATSQAGSKETGGQSQGFQSVDKAETVAVYSLEEFGKAKKK